MAMSKVGKGSKVDLRQYLYVLKRGRFIFILTEPISGKFIFICFTQTDYALGKRSEESPVLAEYYESAESAIDDLADAYDIYQFDNWHEYFNWLILILRGEL